MVSDSLDTCTIVSFILGQPVHQAKAVHDLLESGSMHYVSDLAISEVVYVLECHYEHTHKEVAELIGLFLRNYDEVLNYNRKLYELVFPYYEAHPALSFNDCCLAFYAELTHAEPLFTFDQKLARQHPSAKFCGASGA